jgi:cytochrome c-type biogenesis protein CcmF
MIPFMGLGPVSRWKSDQAARWRAELLAPAIAALLCALTLPFLHGDYNPWVALAVLLAAWLVFGLCKDLRYRVRGATTPMRGLRRLTPSYCGMFIAHLGFAASVVGVVVTSQYSIEHDLKMRPGDSRDLAGYEFRFVELAPMRGPNYVADEARFAVSRNGAVVAEMAAQKRRYLATGSVMTEAAIDAGLFRDLYIAMGEPIGEAGDWAIRLHYKPMVRWMWLGAIFMAIGGFMTVADRRYRRQRKPVSAVAAGSLLHGT